MDASNGKHANGKKAAPPPDDREEIQTKVLLTIDNYPNNLYPGFSAVTKEQHRCQAPPNQRTPTPRQDPNSSSPQQFLIEKKATLTAAIHPPPQPHQPKKANKKLIGNDYD